MPGYTWPDGSSGHSISWATELAHRAAKRTQPATGAGFSGLPAIVAASNPAFQANGAPAKGLPPAQVAATGGTTDRTPGAQPPDPVLEGMIGALGRRRDETISGLEAQKPQALASYGYTASGYDSSGAPTGLAFDPNNPFSQAALAKRNYDQRQTGTTNSMAARGQLYSGALTSAKAGNELGYQQTTDALQKALTRLLVGIARGEGAARTDYETGVAQARGQRMPTT